MNIVRFVYSKDNVSSKAKQYQKFKDILNFEKYLINDSMFHYSKIIKLIDRW